MDVPLNVEVRCADGDVGRSTGVVVNPVDQEVSHVIVAQGGREYMVPLDVIVESTPDHIQLRCAQGDLSQFKPFEQERFVGGEGLRRLWPFRRSEAAAEADLPYEELSVHRGTHVRASNGPIGRVDEFLVNPLNGHITHLVLLEGNLFGRREVTVPISEIARIEAGTVHLELSKEQVRNLPSAPRGPRFWEYHPDYGEEPNS
ncbi:MAG: PRC-barrel domain-containing protein [Candidatus Promineifilaceae bacterium]|nr:PRC-barrel domain-containing protein [Candidatus Promineifilaceae bacterium]